MIFVLLLTQPQSPLEMVQTLNALDMIIDVTVDDRQQQHSPTQAPSPLPPQQQPQPKYNKLHAVALKLYCILFYSNGCFHHPNHDVGTPDGVSIPTHEPPVQGDDQTVH